VTVRHAGTLPGLLAGWLVEQRWFAAKGTGVPTLTVLGSIPLDVGEVEVGVYLVRATTGSAVATYQLPLTCRRAPEPALADALVGVLDGPGPGGRWVYDGPHDPVFVRSYLRLLSGGVARSAPAAGTAIQASGVAARPLSASTGPSSVLRGEQSNTSVIVDAAGPDPMMLKVFRVLAAGRNPDVVVQTALACAGSDRVPAPAGWIEGSWPSAGSTEQGHLAYACEFLPGSRDAWREACETVEAGEPFAGQARGLGAATAQVHTTLATALPTRPATPEVLGALADGLLARIAWATDAAGVLAPFAPAARAAVNAVRVVRGAPPLQQVHGDYHLGQVLHSPTRGWILLDFEGEPLRPLAERLEPDLALRDVAGMLRSFDYAARHATADAAADDPRVAAATTWAQACREAFLDGYAAVAGADPRAQPEVLCALELDKAFYEVVYETRNRPSWVPVPLGAVRRLLGG
jgi:maltokinase